MYRIYSSDGWSVTTDSPAQAIAQVRGRLEKYGYPKFHEWLEDLDWALDQQTFASSGPWFTATWGSNGRAKVRQRPTNLSRACWASSARQRTSCARCPSTVPGSLGRLPMYLDHRPEEDK